MAYTGLQACSMLHIRTLYKNFSYKNILGLGPPTLRMRPGLAPPSGAWAFKNERNLQAWAAEPKHGQLRICRCSPSNSWVFDD